MPRASRLSAGGGNKNLTRPPLREDGRHGRSAGAFVFRVYELKKRQEAIPFPPAALIFFRVPSSALVCLPSSFSFLSDTFRVTQGNYTPN